MRVREIDDDEGQRLLRIVRRGTGSVVTWRRAQMVLLSAQGMDVTKIAEVTFTSPDRVRDVIHNFNADGFTSLYPKYKGGRPKTFTLPERRDIKKIAKSRPVEHGLPFSTWSLVKLADFLVTEGVVDDISHEGLRILLREEGITFQRLKTWKTSRDPDHADKKARVEHLYAIADGEVIPEAGEPEVVFCMDEFGPLNLQPHPGRQWTGRGGKHKDPDREPRPRRRATYTRPHGVRHLLWTWPPGPPVEGRSRSRRGMATLEGCRSSRPSSRPRALTRRRFEQTADHIRPDAVAHEELVRRQGCPDRAPSGAEQAVHRVVGDGLSPHRALEDRAASDRALAGFDSQAAAAAQPR
ncbi:helix-turn-helix domain-containing protein [Streptomyces mirabilis]